MPWSTAPQHNSAYQFTRTNSLLIWANTSHKKMDCLIGQIACWSNILRTKTYFETFSVLCLLHLSNHFTLFPQFQVVTCIWQTCLSSCWSLFRPCKYTCLIPWKVIEVLSRCFYFNEIHKLFCLFKYYSIFCCCCCCCCFVVHFIAKDVIIHQNYFKRK